MDPEKQTEKCGSALWCVYCLEGSSSVASGEPSVIHAGTKQQVGGVRLEEEDLCNPWEIGNGAVKASTGVLLQRSG